jgi:hypothetical protein
MLVGEDAKSYHERVASHERSILRTIMGPRSLIAAQSPQIQQTFLKRLGSGILEENRAPSEIRSSPTPAFRFIREACEILRATYEEPGLRKDVAAFLRGTLFPLARIDYRPPQAAAAIMPGLPVTVACREAEPRFADVVTQVMRQGVPPDRRQDLTVYCSSDRQPLILAKSREPSSLLLEPICIDGVVFPAGTIADTSRSTRGFRQTGSYEHNDSDWGATVYIATDEANDPWMTQPLRMSPWVYSRQEDQLLFATYSDSSDYDDARGETITSVTLNDFRETAAHLLARASISLAA